MNRSKMKSDIKIGNLDSNQDTQDEFNKAVVARLKKAMQMNIEKYGMPDSSKMEKKLYFIDPKDHFVKYDEPK